MHEDAVTPQIVESADGTDIAYDTVGAGPLVIVIGGAFNTRLSPYPLVALLAEQFSVVSYDRRGRGGSSDVQPYAVEREVEDLAAVIEISGGSAMIYGHSSGAILALEAAAAGLPITKVAVYEPPYTYDSNNPHQAGDDSVRTALDAGNPELATENFLRLTGMEDDAITWMKSSDFWVNLVAVAHTLPYDLTLADSGVVPAARLAAIASPTLVMDGGDSPEWAGRAGNAVATAVAHGNRITIDGQSHAVDHAVLAPVLIEFFKA